MVGVTWSYAGEAAAILAVGALATWIGWRAAARGRRWGAVAAIVGLLGLNLQTLALMLPSLYGVLPQPVACVPELIQALGFAVVGAGAQLTGDRARARVPLAVLGILAAFYVLQGPFSLVVVGQRYSEFDGRADDGVLPSQSSDATCVPSCAAAMLRQRGVAATEGQLAAACRPSWLGTDAFRLLRALDRCSADAGQPWRASLRDGLALHELAGLPRPALLSVVVADVAHAVLLTAVDERGRLTIADPMLARTVTLQPADFETRYGWWGRAVVLNDR